MDYHLLLTQYKFGSFFIDDSTKILDFKLTPIVYLTNVIHFLQLNVLGELQDYFVCRVISTW